MGDLEIEKRVKVNTGIKWDGPIMFYKFEPWDTTPTLHWLPGHPAGKHSTFTLQRTLSNMEVDKSETHFQIT